MKVIKSGSNPFRLTCKRCGCEFIYCNEDVKTIWKEWIDEVERRYVNCPECHLEIPAQIIPSTMPESPEWMDV